MMKNFNVLCQSLIKQINEGKFNQPRKFFGIFKEKNSDQMYVVQYLGKQRTPNGYALYLLEDFQNPNKKQHRPCKVIQTFDQLYQFLDFAKEYSEEYVLDLKN